MTLKDLLDPVKYLFGEEILLRGRVIAQDENTGRQLFDTSNNKRSYIRQFFDREVTAIWSSTKEVDHGAFYGAYSVPVIMLYLSHYSRSKEGEENDC